MVVRPNLWLMTSEEIPPILFTVEEVSGFLRIGRHRVFDLMRAGGLRSVKVGGSRRISARALVDYVASSSWRRRRDRPRQGPNGAGSIYQRRDGRWCGALYVTEADGRRVRRTRLRQDP